jgi:hypothetical protein
VFALKEKVRVPLKLEFVGDRDEIEKKVSGLFDKGISVAFQPASNSRSCIFAAKYWTNVTVLRKPKFSSQCPFSTPQHGRCHEKLTDDAQTSLG